MRHSFSWPALAVLALSSLASAQDETDEKAAAEPEITVTASFPENNPFGHIVNGERNRINLLVENQSDQNVTLISIAGSIHDAQTEALIKNTSALPYGLRLVPGTRVQVPYQFHSEFKPGDIRLNIWLNHAVDDKLYRVTAYDSVVTVVEPPFSLFDYQVITAYLVTAAFLGALGYLAYTTFVPKPKKRKSAVSATGKNAISSPVGSVAASGAGYEEEWIPEHHLKLRSGKKKAGATSSGDELSAGEASGTEGKKRKGRK